MASYKIYFLDFCHKNRSSIQPKSPATLQNATWQDIFIENRSFCSTEPPISIVARGTFFRASGGQLVMT